MSRMGKFIKAESRLVVARSLGRGKWGVTANGYGVSLGGNENILKLDSSDSCITMRIY